MDVKNLKWQLQSKQKDIVDKQHYQATTSNNNYISDDNMTQHQMICRL